MNAYRQFRQKSRQTALCGLLAALSAAILSLGSLIPLAAFACPMLAMVCLLPVLCDYGPKAALTAYAAAASLGLMLCVDKEPALLYLFLGWYPALRPRLEKLPLLPRLAAKAGAFCLPVTAMYAALLFLFRLEAVAEEFKEYSGWMLAGLLAFGCGVFLLFDRTLGILTQVFRRRKRRCPFS